MRLLQKKKVVCLLVMKYGNKFYKAGLKPIFPKLYLIPLTFFLYSKYSAVQLEELLKPLDVITYIDLKWTFCTQAYKYHIKVHHVYSNPIVIKS